MVKAQDNNLLREYIEEEPEQFFIILPSNSFSNSLLRKKVASYHLSAMIDLGSCFKNTGALFTLFLFSKKYQSAVKIGICLYKRVFNREKIFRTPLQSNNIEYSTLYKSYINDIQKWLRINVFPSSKNQYYECKEVPIEEIDMKHLRPVYYSTRYTDIRKNIQKNELVLLGEIAELLSVNLDEKLTIKAGDLIIPSVGSKEIQLVRIDTMNSIKIANADFVIRPKCISSDYLFLYLKSQTGKLLIEMNQSGTVLSQINRKTLVKLPIIIQKDSNDYYQKMVDQYFDNENFIKNYDYFNELKKIDYVGTSVPTILEVELVNESILLYKELKRKVIDEDLKEINTCFSVEAYKATTILVGSVLEAFLLDWLSEIEKTDYVGGKRTVNLCTCIDKLSKINGKNFVTKAHNIRKSRNLIHPKVFLEKNTISRQTTEGLINDLKEIIASR